MNPISILMIALALAMDAFAVSISSGVSQKEVSMRRALLMAGFFGMFQALMPVLGWLSGRWAIELIQAFDHWIAFGLLLFIGGKMIHEGIQTDGQPATNPFKLRVLLMLSLSTSIDALAVGVSLSFLKTEILTPALMIGLITFLLSFFGVYIGKIFGHIFEKKLEIIGGLILMGIGIKILVEHLFFYS